MNIMSDKPETIPGDELKKWEKRRLQTFIVFCLLYAINGMKYGLFIDTCWVYVKRQLKPESPYFIYSIIIISRYLTAGFFGFPLTHWHDRHRRTRLIMISINYVSIIGSFFYIVSTSFLFPLIGSFLLGLPFLMQPVAIGELSRAYSPKHVTQKLPLLTFVSYIGYFPAALLLYITKNIQFDVGPFRIEYGNFLGVVMAISYCMLQVATVFFVHDLSLEYDLKSNLLWQKTQYREIGEPVEGYSTNIDDPGERLVDQYLEINTHEFDARNATVLSNLKRLFTNVDILLVYGLVWLYYYSASLIFTYIPIVVEKELDYDIQMFNVLLLIYGLILIMVIPLVLRVKIGSKFAFIIGLLSFSSMIIILICFQGINRSYTKLQNIVLLAVIMTLLSFFSIGEDLFLTCTISKFVKPDIQTFADGVRSTCMVLGQVFGNLSITLIVADKHIVFDALLILITCSTIILLSRKNALMKPEPII